MAYLIEKKLVVLDLEVYPNYVLFAFRREHDGVTLKIELRGEDSVLTDKQRTQLRNMMLGYVTFGYNSNKYDMPLIVYAMSGATANEIYEFGDEIITKGLQPWEACNRRGISIPATYRHFDIMEPAPAVRISLKLYMARLHAKKIQDLPIEVGKTVTEEEMDILSAYCDNDLIGTIQLFNAIRTDMELRDDMSAKYGINLMSKSDAQVAEAVIVADIQNKLKRKVFKPSTIPKSVRYTIPKFIHFRTELLRGLLDVIRNHEFVVNPKNGKVQLPKEVKGYKIKIGTTQYQLGIGGLHSKEKGQVVVPKKGETLADRDVTSYYPFIIRNLELFPQQLTMGFLDIYCSIIDERVEAKNLISQYKKAAKELEAKGDKGPEFAKLIEQFKFYETKAGMLKICVNGSFGKFGSKFSKLYSPDLMLAVTLTGQLSLLMLIEHLELHGIKVVSGNTDGFVSLIPEGRYEIYDSICFDWELATGFNLEETQYSGLYSRNVNNYFAVTTSGEVKGKGTFTNNGIRKNPAMGIVSKAVTAYLVDGTPFMKTLKECDDFTEFLNVRSVTGGAVFDGQFLGRVVRWAYTTAGKTIRYAKNGNLVPKSAGGEPFQDLPDKIPANLDYIRYEHECRTLYNAVIEKTPDLTKLMFKDIAFLNYVKMLKSLGDVEEKEVVEDKYEGFN